MERPSRFPDIRIPTLGGLNERPSPANLRTGEFDVLEGMYPAQIGLLQRIPGKTLLATTSGEILSIHPTYNSTSDVLVSTTAGRYVYTLDELFNRATTPNLVFPPTPEEEDMSMAIIIQREANTVAGGSIAGFISGTDSSSAVNTMYARRLTDMVLNQTGTAGITVSAFAAATGGAGAPSGNSIFGLDTGTYRISCWAMFFNGNLTAKFLTGLLNLTSGLYEVHSGTSIPIISDPVSPLSGSATAHFEAMVTVTGGQNFFQIAQETDNATPGHALVCGGNNYGTAANINGAAVRPSYCTVKILRIT